MVEFESKIVEGADLKSFQTGVQKLGLHELFGLPLDAKVIEHNAKPDNPLQKQKEATMAYDKYFNYINGIKLDLPSSPAGNKLQKHLGNPNDIMQENEF